MNPTQGWHKITAFNKLKSFERFTTFNRLKKNQGEDAYSA